MNNELDELFEALKYRIVIDEDGSKFYHNNKDELHRETGPAIEWHDGSKAWWINGKRHREDGPAIEWANGCKFWFINGERTNRRTIQSMEKG